jgi:hypothetical protein
MADPRHDVPEGWARRWLHALAGPLAHDFTVYVVNRTRGLRPGESMSDIAGHLASAIEHDLGQPVFLQGASTGGSVARSLLSTGLTSCGDWLWFPRRTGWDCAGISCRLRWRG